MKAKILDINGKEKGNIELPEFFSEKVREDIIAKVLETER
jgi:ribosomal protein L4